MLIATSGSLFSVYCVRIVARQTAGDHLRGEYPIPANPKLGCKWLWKEGICHIDIERSSSEGVNNCFRSGIAAPSA
jgi:hypothetical protein